MNTWKKESKMSEFVEIQLCWTNGFLTWHSMKTTGVNNKRMIQGPGIAHAGSVSHCHGLRGHLNRAEPLLMLLVTPVLFY